MKTKLILSFMAVSVSILLTVCGTKLKKKKKINVSFLKGPSGMGGAYMWTKSDLGETANNYNITLDYDSTAVAAKLAAGEYDIACIPANLASAVYEKSAGKIKVIAVNTLGMLYIISKNGAVAGVKDLEGKTILSAGQGTVAEFALDFILKNNGINASVAFTSQHSETVNKALNGENDILLLPEPFASQLTNADNSFSVGIDITAEWKKSGGTMLTMGCIAVNSDFYNKNRKAADIFINEYKESVDYVNGNYQEAAVLINSHNIMNTVVAEKAIPKCNIVCLTNRDMETAMLMCEYVLGKTEILSLPDDFFIHTD